MYKIPIDVLNELINCKLIDDKNSTNRQWVFSTSNHNKIVKILKKHQIWGFRNDKP